MPRRNYGENSKLKVAEVGAGRIKDGKMVGDHGANEFELKADLVFLTAIGFTNPLAQGLNTSGIEQVERGNAKATTDGAGCLPDQ